MHLDVDVQDIGCDFYAVTGHKLYGPSGIGVLYGKYGHLAAMRAVQRRRRDDPRGVPRTPSPMAIRRTASRPGRRRSCRRSGSAPRIDYIDSIGKPRIRAHEADLVHYAQERLREINSLRIIGTTKDKGPIVSFELKGAHPHDVATIIDRSGVAVRAGTHCVMPLLDRFGVSRDLPGVVCALQHPRGDRRSRAIAGQGAGVLRMTDESGKPPGDDRGRAGRGDAAARAAPATSATARDANWRGSPTRSSPR